jgi:hypothetical protein
VLAALLTIHGFDFEHCICPVTCLLVIMRTKCDEDRLQNCGDVIHNVFHALGRANGLTVHINYAAAGATVQSNAPLEEFA